MLDNVSKGDVATCRTALAKCPEVQATIERAKACGLDCQDQDNLIKLAKEFLTKYNQLYGPQFPSRGE